MFFFRFLKQIQVTMWDQQILSCMVFLRFGGTVVVLYLGDGCQALAEIQLQNLRSFTIRMTITCLHPLASPISSQSLEKQHNDHEVQAHPSRALKSIVINVYCWD